MAPWNSARGIFVIVCTVLIARVTYETAVDRYRFKRGDSAVALENSELSFRPSLSYVEVFGDGAIFLACVLIAIEVVFFSYRARSSLSTRSASVLAILFVTALVCG